MKRALVLAVAVVALVVGATACEPKMTITATAPASVPCDELTYLPISGTVSPAPTGAAWVVLQQSTAGKWSDVYGSSQGVNAKTLRKASVAGGSGAWQMTYLVGDVPTSTVRFRVRSNGGGSFSKSFYVRFAGSC